MRFKNYISFCFATAVLFGMQSCAMLFNEKSQCLKIRTDSTVQLIKADTTKLLFHEKNDVEYYVRRGKQPLRLDFAVKDSLRFTYYLQAKLSPAFLLANAASPMGIGYVVDLFHQKKYMYPGNNYFTYDSVKHKIIHYNTKPSQPGLLKVRFGWNYLNLYHASLFKQSAGDASILGLNLGAEYFLTQTHALQGEIGYATSGSARFPKRYHLNEPFDSLTKSKTTSFWLTATYKVHHQRWSVGAGLCFAGQKYYEMKNYYTSHDTIYKIPLDTFRIKELSHKRSTMTPLIKTGLCFKVDYKLAEFMNLGVNWHCYLADLNKSSFYTSHFLNFYVDFNVYEMNLKRKKQKYANDRPKE